MKKFLLVLMSLNEPLSQPDVAHYDALSMVKLGQSFGEEILK